LLEGTHCEAKYRFLVLEHPHLWDEDIGSSASWRARTMGRSLKIPSHPTCRLVVKI
jgi:hypothetical protein